jgi:L-alanine-DL-glutamate epimerase-like enolase superfamily enzyme
MKITDISWKPERLPLKTPFKYAADTLYFLDYARVTVSTDSGWAGCGHVAIAPESTGDTLESVAGAVGILRTRLRGHDPNETELLVDLMDSALNFNSACKAAIEAATLMIRSEAAQQPLHKLIGSKLNDRIRITYTLGIQNPETIADEARRAINRGFKRLKVKVNNDIKRAHQALSAIRSVDAHIGLSVDANQSWVRAEDAICIIRELEKYGLDWVEQPIRIHDINGNAVIRRALPGVKLMLDESVQSYNECEYAIEHEALDMVCIKLAKTGGVTHAKKLIRICEDNGKEYVLASMIESVLANAVAIHLAACYRFSACEAGGLYLISQDIASGLPLEEGSVRVPDGPGLGVLLSREPR